MSELLFNGSTCKIQKGKDKRARETKKTAMWGTQDRDLLQRERHKLGSNIIMESEFRGTLNFLML